MTYPFAPFGAEVLVLRYTATGPNKFGNEIASYVPDDDPYLNVPVYFRDPNGQGSNESRSDQMDEVRYGMAALMPTQAGVTAYDRVRIDGVDWDIDGAPQLLRSPFNGWTPGTLINLRRVEGG